MPVEAVLLTQITDTHCFSDDQTPLGWTSDIVFSNQSLQKVLAHLTAAPGRREALICTGDLSQEETPESYRRLTEIFSRLPWPVFAIPGNHDVPDTMLKNLGGRVTFPKHQEVGAWRLIFLNTYSGHEHGELNEARLQELDDLLKQMPTNQFAAIFMHHHPLPVGSEWLDRMGLEQPQRFKAVIEKYPQVKAVFHGHIHQEFDGSFKGANGNLINVFGTPSTCIQTKRLSKTPVFEHTRPAWRDILLLPNGEVNTHVEYLD